jgi:hypothetical protein
LWNLITLTACFPLMKRPLISARLHSRSAPATAACCRHSTRYHRNAPISAARDQRRKQRATDQRGNTEAVNQGGNRRAVESEWRKAMGIDEGDRGEKMETGQKRRLWRGEEMSRRLSTTNRRAIDQGGKRGSVETEWRRSMRIDEGERGERGEKMDASGQGAIVEESGQAQARVSLGKHFVIDDSVICLIAPSTNSRHAVCKSN